MSSLDCAQRKQTLETATGVLCRSPHCPHGGNESCRIELMWQSEQYRCELRIGQNVTLQSGHIRGRMPQSLSLMIAQTLHTFCILNRVTTCSPHEGQSNTFRGKLVIPACCYAGLGQVGRRAGRVRYGRFAVDVEPGVDPPSSGAGSSKGLCARISHSGIAGCAVLASCVLDGFWHLGLRKSGVVRILGMSHGGCRSWPLAFGGCAV